MDHDALTPPRGMWAHPDVDPRHTGEPVLRGERAVVLDYLRAYRLTFEMKCEGLDAEQLARRSVPPSTMSLLGLVRHLAKVEHSWARRVVQAQPHLDRLYRTEEQPDLDFDGAVADPAVVEEAWASWRREVTHAESVYATIDLDRLCPHPDGELEVRDVLVHLVEEYARHCGHADLLRECIDGRTGQ
ncbi:DinB family protein [Nocardioides rubriscoriae]|uniref:DinB family protein n=1 Tax=Nocardioides rubriscoriae TaxID=642762 RepID=UPI001B863127|nr:DinB family protein [Nocardioides rubriscoriae]